MKHQQIEDISNLYNSIYEDKQEAPKEMVSLTEEEIQEAGAFRTGNINLPSSRRGFSLGGLRSTVVDAGGAVGAHRGRGKHGNVLGIPEKIGRQKGREAAGSAFDKVISGNVGGAIKDVQGALRETKDSFDIIKDHLIDEGYADTEEAALAIMTNMSEEWKTVIIEQSREGFRDGRYHLPDGSHMGPIPGALRALFGGNLPKSTTVVPPTHSGAQGTQGKVTSVTQTRKPKPRIPYSKTDSGELTDFGAGGGRAKMEKTGMSVAEVEALGRKNKNKVVEPIPYKDGGPRLPGRDL